MKKKIIIIAICAVIFGIGIFAISNILSDEKDDDRDKKPSLESIDDTENDDELTTLNPTGADRVTLTPEVTSPVIIAPTIVVDPGVVDITPTPTPTPVEEERHDPPIPEEQLIKETVRLVTATQYSETDANALMDTMEQKTTDYWYEMMKFGSDRNAYIAKAQAYAVDPTYYLYSNAARFGGAIFDEVKSRNMKIELTKCNHFVEKLRYVENEDALLFDVYGTLNVNMVSNTLPDDQYSIYYFLGYKYFPDNNEWLIYEIEFECIFKGDAIPYRPAGSDFGLRGDLIENWDLGFI